MNMINHILFICFLEAVHCYVNLALNKPAYQENPFKRSYSIGDASNAVDGQKSNLTRNGGQCVLSAGKETAMLWVNLTSIHSIYNISIYYKTDDKPWGPRNDNTGFFLGFSLFVCNTTNRLNGTLCFKDTHYTQDTIPSVVTVVCPVHGQYVIYYNERLSEKTYPDDYHLTAENNICEIEVYGCPATGCYGSNNEQDYDGIRFIGTQNNTLRYLNSGKTDDSSQILMIVGSITAITVVLVPNSE